MSHAVAMQGGSVFAMTMAKCSKMFMNQQIKKKKNWGNIFTCKSLIIEINKRYDS